MGAHNKLFVFEMSVHCMFVVEGGLEAIWRLVGWQYWSVVCIGAQICVVQRGEGDQTPAIQCVLFFNMTPAVQSLLS